MKKKSGKSKVGKVQQLLDQCVRVGQDEVAPAAILKNRWNGHRCANADLVASVKAQGVLMPLVVRRVEGGGVEIVDGSRRLDAALRSKTALVPVAVYEMTDELAQEITLMLNLQREDLPVLDEAEKFATLLELRKGDAKQVAAEIGVHWTKVVRRAALGKLSPKLVKAVKNPDHPAHLATAQMLEELAKYPHGVQEHVLENNGRESWFWEMGRICDTLADLTHHLRLAPWDLEDALLCPQAGACVACQKRSDCHPGLFGDEEDPAELVAKAMCLDGGCWDAKIAAHLVRAEEQARAKHPELVLASTDYSHQSDRSLVQPWMFEKAKKSTPGAVPAFVKFGEDAGKVIWVTLTEPGKARASANPVTSPGGDEPAEEPQGKTLEQKRAELESRRIALIIQQKLLPELNASKLPCPGGDPLSQTSHAWWLRLLGAFGTSDPTHIFEDAECGWAAFDATETIEVDALHQQLWALLKGPLSQSVRITAPSELEPETVQNAMRLADLLGMKWVDLLAWVVDQPKMQEPKSWAKQEKL